MLPAGAAIGDSSGSVSHLTERLLMRPWHVEDLAAFHRIFGDGRVIWWGPEPHSEASARRLVTVIEEQDTPLPGLGQFAVVERTGGRVVGNVLLKPASFEEGIELGYHFSFDAWGHGYATEAARATLQHGFARLGLDRVVAAVAQSNARSLRVVERLGMRRVGTIEQAGLPHYVFECLA